MNLIVLYEVDQYHTFWILFLKIVFYVGSIFVIFIAKKYSPDWKKKVYWNTDEFLREKKVVEKGKKKWK